MRATDNPRQRRAEAPAASIRGNKVHLGTNAVQPPAGSVCSSRPGPARNYHRNRRFPPVFAHLFHACRFTDLLLAPILVKQPSALGGHIVRRKVSSATLSVSSSNPYSASIHHSNHEVKPSILFLFVHPGSVGVGPYEDGLKLLRGSGGETFKGFLPSTPLFPTFLLPFESSLRAPTWRPGFQ